MLEDRAAFELFSHRLPDLKKITFPSLPNGESSERFQMPAYR
jgi:hypothetical protein